MRYVFAGTLVAACLLAACATSSSPTPSDWRQDWVVEDGFAMLPDTAGYHFPTAIAFVPVLQAHLLIVVATSFGIGGISYRLVSRAIQSARGK